MLRNFVLLFLCCGVLSGCSYDSFSSKCRRAQGKAIVSSELLANVDLKCSWQNNLPIKKDEVVEKVFLSDKYVFALTDTKVLICLDRFKGDLRYVKQLTTAGVPVLGPVNRDGMLYFAIGTEVLSLNPANGYIDTILTVENPIVKPIQISQSHIYIIDESKVLSYDCEQKILRSQYAAINNSKVTSMCANDYYLFFSTEAGEVISALINEPVRNWSNMVTAPIHGGLSLTEDGIYVSSLDTNLTKLSPNTGAVECKISLGADLTEPVVVGKDIIFAYADVQGIYAVRPADGYIIWQVQDGRSFVCQDEKCAFIFTKDRQIVCMDNKTGKRLFDINTRNVAGAAENLFDSNIYVYDNSGRIACIETVK